MMKSIFLTSILVLFAFPAFAQSGVQAPVEQGFIIPTESPTNGILIEVEGPSPEALVVDAEGIEVAGTWSQPYPNLELFTPDEPFTKRQYAVVSEVSTPLNGEFTNIVTEEITYSQDPFTITFGGYFEVETCCDDVCEEADPTLCCWSGSVNSSVNGNVSFTENAVAHLVEVTVVPTEADDTEDRALVLPYYARVQNRGVFIPLTGNPGDEKCVTISVRDFDFKSIFDETQCATIESDQQPPALEQIPDTCEGTTVTPTGPTDPTDPNPTDPGTGNKADAGCSQTNPTPSPFWLLLVGFFAFRRRR